MEVPIESWGTISCMWCTWVCFYLCFPMFPYWRRSSLHTHHFWSYWSYWSYGIRRKEIVGIGLGGTHDQIMWLCMNIWKDTQRGQSQEQALTTFFPYLRNINPNWHWHVCDILEPIIGKEGINNGDIQKMFGNWQVRSETTHFPTIYN